MSTLNPLVELEIERGVARVLLNHPPLNILTIELRRQLLERVDQIEKSPAVRLVLFPWDSQGVSAGAGRGGAASIEAVVSVCCGTLRR